MKENRRILVYGHSIIFGSIGAALQQFTEFEVTALTTLLQDLPMVDTKKHGMVLFDLEAIQPATPFFLLETHPSLVLIGVSPCTNLVQVWNSWQLQEKSMERIADHRQINEAELTV